jgi:hypothetical protein
MFEGDGSHSIGVWFEWINGVEFLVFAFVLLNQLHTPYP